MIERWVRAFFRYREGPPVQGDGPNPSVVFQIWNAYAAAPAERYEEVTDELRALIASEKVLIAPLTRSLVRGPAPRSLEEVAWRYAGLFAVIEIAWDQHLQRLGLEDEEDLTPADFRLPREQEELRRLVYDGRLCILCLDQEGEEALYAADAVTELARLRAVVEEREADSPPEPPYAMSVEEGEIVDLPIHIRGSHLNLADTPQPRGLPARHRSHRAAAADRRRRERAARAGPLDHASRAPAHGAGDGQPHLALALRTRPRRHAQQLRHHRFDPYASGAARLAGPALRRRRLVGQGAAPRDPALQHLPARGRLRRGERGGRSRQPAALADEPPAARGRADPRRAAATGRHPRPDDGGARGRVRPARLRLQRGQHVRAFRLLRGPAPLGLHAGGAQRHLRDLRRLRLRQRQRLGRRPPRHGGAVPGPAHDEQRVRRGAGRRVRRAAAGDAPGERGGAGRPGVRRGLRAAGRRGRDRGEPGLPRRHARDRARRRGRRTASRGRGCATSSWAPASSSTSTEVVHADVGPAAGPTPGENDAPSALPGTAGDPPRHAQGLRLRLRGTGPVVAAPAGPAGRAGQPAGPESAPLRAPRQAHHLPAHARRPVAARPVRVQAAAHPRRQQAAAVRQARRAVQRDRQPVQEPLGVQAARAVGRVGERAAAQPRRSRRRPLLRAFDVRHQRRPRRRHPRHEHGQRPLRAALDGVVDLVRARDREREPPRVHDDLPVVSARRRAELLGRVPSGRLQRHLHRQHADEHRRGHHRLPGEPGGQPRRAAGRGRPAAALAAPPARSRPGPIWRWRAASSRTSSRSACRPRRPR